MYIRQQLAHSVTLWKYSESGTTLWVKLTIQSITSPDLYIGVCYLPPESSNFYLKGCNADACFQELMMDISDISALGDYVVCGDFNARTGNLSDTFDTQEWHNSDVADYLPNECQNKLSTRQNQDQIINLFGHNLINLCQATSTYVLNGRIQGDMHGNYTCRANGGSSTVDYFLGSQHIANKLASALVVHQWETDSDHNALTLTLPNNTPINTPTDVALCNEPGHEMVNPGLRYCYDKALKEDYIKNINDPLVHNLFRKACEGNVSACESASLLKQAILTAVKLTYKKVGKNSKSQRTPKAWFDKECREAKRKLKSFLRSQTDGHYADVQRKVYRDLIRRKKRKFRCLQGEQLVELARKDPKRFWKHFKPQSKVNPETIPTENWATAFHTLLNTTTADAVDNTMPSIGSVPILASANKRADGSSLDIDFTPAEVITACKSLKRGKATDLYGIRAEHIIDAVETTAVHFTCMFNKIFNGTFPNHCAVGVIHPIFKSGDAQDCMNYRGITVGDTLGKLYATILNNRINKWAEQNDLRAKGQAGFRKGYRTSDNMLILRTIIDNRKSAGGKLFACFVDFKKAFDTVPRELLWKELLEKGISGKMLAAVMAIYSNVQACVRNPCNPCDYSRTFPCTIGVKQGCPLSPTLFGLYVDKLESHLMAGLNTVMAPRLGHDHVPSLMYADDVAILSYSQVGLQNALNILDGFCHEQGLTVNLQKTQVVVFNDRSTKEQYSSKYKMYYRSSHIDTVESYCYLGVIFHRSADFKQAIDKLTLAAKRAYHCFIYNCKQNNITDIPLKCQLFDTLVKPILTYGSEVWGSAFMNSGWEPVERLHRTFLKRILGVKNATPNFMVLAEFVPYLF
jgi:exonuclease III